MNVNHAHRIVVLLALLCAGASTFGLGALPAWAAEVHTNGTGGGNWSDPGTWHGGKVPTAEDIAVIAMRDTLRVDVADAVCGGLYLDPEAVLTFPETDEHLMLSIGGPIDSYGVIRMDATQSPRGVLEIRLTGDDNAARTVQLRQHASVLVYGRETAGSSSRNVRLTAPPLGEGDDATRVAGLITSSHPDVAIDLQHAQLDDVAMHLTGIDNTGGNPAQRLNIIGNRFTGHANILLEHCDTPAIRDNTFNALDITLRDPAVRASRSKLVNIRSNRFTGKYAYGIFVDHDTDSTVRDNTITGADRGIYMRGVNGMLTSNVVNDAEIGILIHHGSAIGEGLVARNCKVGYSLNSSSTQFTSCGVLDVPEEGLAMELTQASASLLNSNISDDLIKLSGDAPASGNWVDTFQYLVVGFPALMASDASDASVEDDKRPATVHVQTADVSGGVPKDKADLNVRNAPAPVQADGLTPLPNTTRALTLKSWHLGRDGKRQNAPFYDLIVRDADGEQLHQQMIEPSEVWFRPQPNANKPTLEVSLP